MDMHTQAVLIWQTELNQKQKYLIRLEKWRD